MKQMNYDNYNDQINALQRQKKKVKKQNAWWKMLLVGVLLVVLFVTSAMGGYVLSSMYIAPKVNVPVVNDDPNKDTNITREKGDYTILVAGKDKVGWNTDTIMVGHIDTKNDVLNIMSIPRDTMSNVKRYVKKINAAYGVGGEANIEQLKSEISDLLGINVDRYVVVNLDAFEEIIDAIGGVTINVPKDMKYKDPYQDLVINISAGEQTLDGNKAIGFVRFRSGYADGDMGRIEAQQLFIKALINKVATPAIVADIPELASIVKDNMDTDMTLQEIIWFAKQGLEVDFSTGITMHILPGEAHYVWSGSQWLSYYLPFGDEILEMVNQSFNPYDSPITADMQNLVDLNELIIQEYDGEIVNKVTKRNYLPPSNTDKDKDKSTSDDDKGKTNDNSADVNAENQEPADADNNTDADKASSGDDDSNKDDQTDIVIITDDKGNTYEIDRVSGQILNVIPAKPETPSAEDPVQSQE